jgi:hypothetical protein
MRVEKKDLLAIDHVLHTNRFQQGDLAADWLTEDIEAGTPLNIPYFDWLTCLILADTDFRDHGDRPTAQYLMCNSF